MKNLRLGSLKEISATWLMMANRDIALANSAACPAYNAAAKDAYEASAAAANKPSKEAHRAASKKHLEAAESARGANNIAAADLHQNISDAHLSAADGAMSEAHIGNFSPAGTPDSGGRGAIAKADMYEALPTAIHNQADRQAELGTNGGDVVMVLDNASELDEDGWALIAPFGEHPKTRVYSEGGRVKEQKFIQVLDNESADQMMAKENSFFRSLRRAIIGIPVYKGHGDLKDIDPKALSNDAKIKLGVVDKIRKGARGIEAHFALDNEGADAVAEGCKLPSALWLVLPIGNQRDAGPNDAIRCRPFKLISVALTRFPNISGVESLANQRDAGPGEQVPAANQTENQIETDPMKQILIGWLAAQGVPLANDATDQQVLTAFTQEMSTRTASITALGNEKTTIASKVTALENEKTTLTTRVTELTTALSNEQAAVKTERKAAATAVADLAIQRGRKTVADRDATIAALENSKDFAADSKTLLEGKVVAKVAGQDNRGIKAIANEDQIALQNEYNQALQTELIATGQNVVAAHTNVMTLPKYAGLAAKFKTKEPGSAAGIGYAHA